MATDTEQLVVLLEARIADFERNMRKANSTAQKEFGAIERRGEISSRRLKSTFTDLGASLSSSISGFGKGLLAGGLATLASEQTLRAVRQVVADVANLADEAARINLPVEQFQALAYAGRQSGVEQGKLVDLMQFFAREVGEAVNKGNDLAKILAANGVSLTDANGKLKSQQELFYTIVDLIRNARSEQDRVVIATAAFGKAAADALPFLMQGSEAIKASEKAARDAGAVINEQLVMKAAEFDDRWTSVLDTFAAKGKSAVLEILVDLEALIKMADDFLTRMGAQDALGQTLAQALRHNPATASSMWFLDRYMGTPGTDTKAPAIDQAPEAKKIEENLTDLAEKRKTIEKDIADLKANDAAPIQIEEFSDRLDTVIKQIEEAQRRLDQLRSTPGPSFEMNGRGYSTGPATVVPQKLGQSADDLKGSARDLTSAANALATTGLMSGAQGPVDPRNFSAAAKSGILSLIRQAEGTAGPNGYNTSLAHGRFLPGGREQPLSVMTLDQIDALQTGMLRHPDNHFNSSAVGAYQIVQTTLRGLREELGLSGDTLYSPELQDQLGATLLARRGNSPAALRQEWQGLNRVSDADINTALGQSSDTYQTGTDALNQRAEAAKKVAATQQQATDQLLSSAQQENSSLRSEAQAMQLNTFEAAKLRKEQELLAQARSAGIPITDSLKASISTLATEYGRGQVAIENVRTAQERAAQSAAQLQQAQQQAMQAQQQFGSAFGGAVKGFIGDLIAGEDATVALQNALSGLADQLVSMAVDWIFSGLFGGGSGGKMGGGKMGGMGGAGLFGLMGFADGGLIKGKGTGRSDSILARVSNGEFVVRADQVAKHRALLEAINNDRIPRFANGGIVGKPDLPNSPGTTGGGAPVTLNTSVNVNANGGDPQQNADLAKKIGQEVERNIRGLVVKELIAQKKPGNLLNQL